MRRWGVLFVLSLSVLTALGVATAPAAGAAAPAAPPSPAAWTYAFYTNEDNDLAYTWAQFTRPVLARIPTNPQVHIVAMVDMPGKGGTTLFELGGGACKKVATFPEKDFGSGATLEWFLE
ncbi:MAG: hypothetical protein ACXVP1_06385, partial [Thermoleophilia bacterium]